MRTHESLAYEKATKDLLALEKRLGPAKNPVAGYPESLEWELAFDVYMRASKALDGITRGEKPTWNTAPKMVRRAFHDPTSKNVAEAVGLLGRLGTVDTRKVMFLADLMASDLPLGCVFADRCAHPTRRTASGYFFGDIEEVIRLRKAADVAEREVAAAFVAYETEVKDRCARCHAQTMAYLEDIERTRAGWEAREPVRPGVVATFDAEIGPGLDLMAEFSAALHASDLRASVETFSPAARAAYDAAHAAVFPPTAARLRLDAAYEASTAARDLWSAARARVLRG